MNTFLRAEAVKNDSNQPAKLDRAFVFIRTTERCLEQVGAPRPLPRSCHPQLSCGHGPIPRDPLQEGAHRSIDRGAENNEKKILCRGPLLFVSAPSYAEPHAPQNSVHAIALIDRA